MKTIFDHIEYVKGKPHHIRRRVAFGTAAGITALIALVWLSSSLATGAFAIQGTSFDAQSPTTAAGTNDAHSGLAGAAAALPSENANVPAHIEIIDAAASTSGQKKAEQTVIPF